MIVSVQDLSKLVDYAHEGTGFPTWHRQFLLWLEREIQVAIDDIEFRLPYWDWSDPDQREILFKSDRLGENVKDTTFPDLKRRVVVKGELFDNWDTYCWTVDYPSESLFLSAILLNHPIKLFAVALIQINARKAMRTGPARLT